MKRMRDDGEWFEPKADIGAIAEILGSRKYWIIVFALTIGIVFWLYSSRLPKIYRAESLISVVENPGGEGNSSGASANRLGALASVVGVNLSGGQGRRFEYVALLSSRRLLAQLITVDNLLPVIFASRWDSVLHKWKPTWNNKKDPTLNDGISYFANKVLLITDDKKTGLVSVRIDWIDPTGAAQWADQLVSMVNEDVRRTTSSEATRSIEFLNKELANTSEIQVRDSIYRLLETNLGKITLTNVQPEYALKVIDPPIAPDADQYVSPRPTLLAMAGAMLGALAFSGVLLWRRRHIWLIPRKLSSS